MRFSTSSCLYKKQSNELNFIIFKLITSICKSSQFLTHLFPSSIQDAVYDEKAYESSLFVCHLFVISCGFKQQQRSPGNFRQSDYKLKGDTAYSRELHVVLDESNCITVWDIQ